MPNGSRNRISRTHEDLWVEGDTITYTCEFGYRYKSGNLERICNASGMWSGKPLLCEGKQSHYRWSRPFSVIISNYYRDGL